MVSHCFHGFPFTMVKHTSQLCRERQSASIFTTRVYILAHGSCHWLRTGQWRKCHREWPSMEASSSRGDETETNHNHVHSCSFQQRSAHDLLPSLCDFSRGTTFKDHKSCKCHQSLTKAICPESSLCDQVHSSSPDSRCRDPFLCIYLLQVVCGL